MFKHPAAHQPEEHSSSTQNKVSIITNAHNSADGPSKSTYHQLLEKFERLCLEMNNDNEEPDPDIFDLTQDDSEVGLVKLKLTRAKSAPELSPPLPIRMKLKNEPVPYVFMFDPSTSRAGQARLSGTTDIEELKDAKLQCFYQRCKGLTFELFMEEFSRFAREEQYTKELFLTNLALISRPFALTYQTVEEGLGQVNQSFCKIDQDFFCRMLQALNFDIQGASRMQMYISLHRKMGALELIKGDHSYEAFHAKTEERRKVTGRYSMVVIEDDSRKKIIIGHGLHFNIAQGRKTVLFAGNIEFNQDGQVLNIDDHSGGYHGLPQENIMVRISRKKALTKILEEVGLPSRCFNSQFDESISTHLLSRPINTGSDKLPLRRRTTTLS